MNVVVWVASSLDLSPAKNAWNVFAHDVYGHDHQYKTAGKLKFALRESLRRKAISYIRNLVLVCPINTSKLLKSVNRRLGTEYTLW